MRFRWMYLLLGALLLAACASAPRAVDGTPTPASGLARQADALLAPLAERGDFSGAVLLARGGQVLLSRGYGLASIEFGVAAAPQTKFRVASITKTFTSLALAQLQQRGKLSLGESLCRFLPDCPPAWQPVTLAHLLTHTSGIPDVSNCPGCPRPPLRASMTISTTIETITQFFHDAPLVTEAGSTYSYSNLGYGLLGYVIERAAGQSYEEFLKASILEPLAMRDTGLDHSSLVLKNRATGYSTVSTLADYNNIDSAYAAGGLYATAEDLYRYDQALYTDQLLPAAARAELFAPRVHVRDADGEYDYGYGWHISRRAGHSALWHGGLLPGFRSVLMRFPDDRATVIVLSNIETADVATIADRLAELLFAAR